jgi:2-methylcitrate dehydratase
MKKELQNRQIAKFALNASYKSLSPDIIEQLKIHLLDAAGSLIHSTRQPSIQKVLKQIKLMGESGHCKVPLAAGMAYDRAAQFYTALIRYPDFMDNFLGKEATCHPSDNIGALLAIAQYKKTSGKDFLIAMAVAYQLQCRLVKEIPVMKEGIDHTLLLGYSIIASVARLIGLKEEQAAHALGIAGSSIAPMVSSRAAYTYEWKGFASSMDASECVEIAFLAKQGMTGPIALFEGPKGFKEVFDMKLDYDWSNETFELIPRCILKKYNAEVHAQSTLEAVIDLKEQFDVKVKDIKKIDITTFLTAYHIIGSGAYGNRKLVASKEQADHSLFYLVAVALIDGEVYPEQFLPERINRKDVQQLLQKVFVHTGFPLHKPVTVAGILDPYTQVYPDKMKSKVTIHLSSGKKLTCEKEDYHGFFTRPFTWEDCIEKFKRLTNPVINSRLQQDIINTIHTFEKTKNSSTLIEMLAAV